MVSITRWEPFSGLMSLGQAMEGLFEERFIRPSRLREGIDGRHYLPLDIYQTPDDLVVRAALPGVKPEDVDITITEDTLTIKGEYREEDEVKDRDYLRHERRYGPLSRSVSIPVPVDGDKAEAVFEDGILTLTLPKAEGLKPKQIKVKAKG